jgi:hypothetical protein
MGRRGPDSDKKLRAVIRTASKIGGAAAGGAVGGHVAGWEGAAGGAATANLPRAQTFLKAFGTFSQPVLVSCDDGRDYVVKGQQVGRAIVNDQIVAHLGAAMGAPTGEVALVEIPAELIAIEPQLRHITPGVAHGCLYIENCTERAAIQHVMLPENRERFAALAILYGWMDAHDHQFIYRNVAPELVYSVDHGHFFPNGPNWTPESLQTAPPPAPDATLMADCMLDHKLLHSACSRLGMIDDEHIATILAVPPMTWACPLGDRVALGAYLADRRDVLKQAY